MHNLGKHTVYMSALITKGNFDPRFPILTVNVRVVADDVFRPSNPAFWTFRLSRLHNMNHLPEMQFVIREVISFILHYFFRIS